MKYFKKIEGENIYLSPICMDEVPTYVKWFSDKKITANLHQVASLATITSEQKWIEKINERKNEYNFAIIQKEKDLLIGNCSITNINLVDGTATLGIFIGEEEYRNKGYGSQALKLLLKYGFDMLRLHNIKLDVFDFNEQAIACYKKVGFKEYGRRHECYFLDGKYHDSISMEILDRDFKN